MQHIFIQIVFGWPFIGFSLVIGMKGIIVIRPALLTAAAVSVTQPPLYLSSYPSLRWLTLLLPKFILGVANSIKRGCTPTWHPCFRVAEQHL